MNSSTNFHKHKGTVKPVKFSSKNSDGNEGYACTENLLQKYQ